MSVRFHVLIRPDVGLRQGLGHLHRCLALAKALERADMRCVFLTVGEDRVRSWVEAAGFTAHTVSDVRPGSERDLEETLKLAGRFGCDVIAVDSYAVGTDYLFRLRNAGFFVVALDDLARYPFPCHMVINGSLGAEVLSYDSSTGDTLFLLGPKYILLREEFWAPQRRRLNAKVSDVLITIGGADGRNLTSSILEILDCVPGDFSVMAVIGPFFSNAGAIEAVTGRCQRRVRLLHSPDSLRDLMLEADLAVCAGGQTLYELAATGTPAVGVQVVENQTGNIQSFTEHGVITAVIFRDSTELVGALGNAVNSFRIAPDRRMQMSRAGQGLVDGLGALRVAEVLAEAVRGYRHERSTSS